MQDCPNGVRQVLCESQSGCTIRGIRHKPKRMFGDAWRNGRAPRAAAPAAATANEDARSRFAKKAELGYVQLKEKFTAKTAQIADAAIEMQVNKFFRWVGPYAKDAMVPPYLPCLLYTSPSPRDGLLSRMPSSA